MENLKQLIEDRGSKVTELETVLAIEKPSEDDLEKARKIRGEIKDLTTRVTLAQDLKAEKDNQLIASLAAGQPTQSELGSERDKKDLRSYSLATALRSQMGIGEKLSGIELEMHQEAQGESEKGITGLGIPSKLILPMGFDKKANWALPEYYKRETTVGGDAGNTVETELDDELIAVLRPRLQVLQMGAEWKRNLKGDLDISKQTGPTTATWKGETAAADSTDPVYDIVSLRPNRLTAYTSISKQLLIQSKHVTTQEISRDLERAVGTEVDRAALVGTGVSPEPEGILNTTGVGTVDATNGPPTYELIVDLETQVAQDNADFGTQGYLSTPTSIGQLKKTKLDAGSGQFVVWQMQSELNGYPFRKTTNFGGEQFFFGNWGSLIIGSWGGVDILVNPYSEDINGKIRVTINSYWDTAVRWPEGFAIMQNIVLP